MQGFRLLVFVVFFLAVSEASARLAILYPDVRKPYDSFFLTIINGVKEKTKEDVKVFVVGKDVGPDVINEWLDKINPKAVLALGNRSMHVLEKISDNRIVLGVAIMTDPRQCNFNRCVSLIPDPSLYFAKLKEVSTGVKNVHLLHSKDASKWFVDLALQKAKKNGFSVVVHETNSLSTSAKIYKDLLGKINPHTEAIWLTHDSLAVEENVIMPLILSQSWRRNIIVFSSRLAHVKRGVLFSLYPDERGLGVTLGGLIDESFWAVKSAVNFQPLTNVKVAFNKKTARHNEIVISDKLKQEVDIFFPVR